jgi:5'-nucleotidase
VNRILRKKRPSVVIAGTNPGDNVSVQVVFASGTVAAAIRAAILGIPTIAFSVVVPEEKAPTRDEYSTRYRDLLKIAKDVVRWALDTGLPKSIDFLNVNFPSEVNLRTPILFTRFALRKYDDYVVKRVDLRGRPYYWQQGTIKPESEFEVGTDVHAIHGEQAISITPLSLNMSATAGRDEISKLGNKHRRAGFPVH